MRKILIKLLFYLLKVDKSTKNIIPLKDLYLVQDKNVAEEAEQEIIKRHKKALSVVYDVPYFIEYLYLQVVEKQREHLLTIGKDKKILQQASILFILFLIEEIKSADATLRIEGLKKSRESRTNK